MEKMCVFKDMRKAGRIFSLVTGVILQMICIWELHSSIWDVFLSFEIWVPVLMGYWGWIYMARRFAPIIQVAYDRDIQINELKDHYR